LASASFSLTSARFSLAAASSSLAAASLISDVCTLSLWDKYVLYFIENMLASFTYLDNDQII
jgi:hypothetical protein